MTSPSLSLLGRYHVRCVSARRAATVATLLCVALVVAVFCSLLSLADGLRRALVVAADRHNVIVLAEGATAESNSALTNADVAKLSTTPHLAHDSKGRLLVSPEVVVQTSVRRRGSPPAPASVAVRGVDLDVALAVHAGTSLTAGRWFHAGRDELVVGQAAARQFEPGQIGQKLQCVARTFEIVGIFSAGGGAHESEYWGHLSNVQAAYRRDRYSSATVRLDASDREPIAAAAQRIGSAAVGLRGVGEADYYASQTGNARIVRGLALFVVSIMSVGAVFAAMNTMHAALAGRSRELGMLRAMGFSASSIAAGLMMESTLTAIVGGALGCVASAAFVLACGTADLVGTTTFTSVAFSMRPSLGAITASLGVALLIGALGGLWPARMAARMSVVQTLRTV